MAALGFAAVTLAALLLPVKIYSVLLKAIFLTKFLQIFNLGAISGYFVSRYTKTGPLAEGNPKDGPRFALALFLQFLGLGGVSAALAALFAPTYLPGILCFLLMTPIFAIEPPFRDRGWFFVSLLPDLLISIVLLGLCILSLGQEMTPSITFFLFALVGLIVPTTGLLVARLVGWAGRKELCPLNFRELWVLLGLGGPVYLGTVFFVLASSADRMVFLNHGTDAEIARYFLGYQLAKKAKVVNIKI